MESANLIIRETDFSDCTCFAEWEKQPFIVENFTSYDDRSYEEIAKEYVIRSQESDKIQFTITLRDNNRPIGRVYISRIDNHCDSLDITRIYIGDEDCIGKGYGEEAMRLILEYCFIQLHMERVTIDHLLHNKRAASLYLKLGFQYEGIMRHSGKKSGKYVDLHLMSMLRTEYFEKCSNRE